MKRTDVLFGILRIATDAVMIFAGLILAYFIRMHWFGFFNIEPPITLLPFGYHFSFSIKITGFLLLIMAINGCYTLANEKIQKEFWKIFWSFSAGFSLIIVFFFFIKLYFFSRLIFGIAWLSGLFLVFFGRIILRYLQNLLWGMGIGQTRVLVLGTGELATYSIKFLNDQNKYKVIGILSEKNSAKKTLQGIKIYGNFRKFEEFLNKYKPDKVLLATDKPSEINTGSLARLAHVNHMDFSFLPDESALDLASVEISTLGNYPILNLQATRLSGWGLIAKTIFDKFVAGLSLIIFIPIFLFVSIRIYFEKTTRKKKNKNTEKTIFYASERIGRNGQKFKCWKFRSMVPEADQIKSKLLEKNERKGGVLFKIKNDPRVTPFGKFIRQTSIDELPQLWNVLKGEMSLIGPRPHLPEEVKKYKLDHKILLSVKPGITGYAQVNGHSELSFEDEVRYEMFYLKNWNIWMDIVIFFKTIGVVLKRKNF
jgi:exopolysaccharide biosynthesis polyprenyl glycosylphosphotransferase